MKNRWTAVLVAAALHGAPLAAQWPQWGGPGRDFKAAEALPEASWPPRELWSRPLGEGHSSVLVDGERLYTMFGQGHRETVIALEAATGRTLWKQAYEVGYQPQYEEYRGPHATPLVVGARLFTVGIEGHLLAFDKRTGRRLWGHQLKHEFGYRRPQSGFSPSPIAYRDLVILPVGGDPGRGVMAFQQSSGALAWSRHNLRLAHASPILIRVDGQDQLVVNVIGELLGLEPATGELLWRHERPGQDDNASFTPLWDAERQLLITSYYWIGQGTRAIELRRREGRTQVREAWWNRRARVMHGNGVLDGDRIYLSLGDSPAFLAALDVATGEELWRSREFRKASLVLAGDRLLVLGEEGELALVEAAASGPRVLGRRQVLEYHAWTAPTVVSDRIYLRDAERLVALALER